MRIVVLLDIGLHLGGVDFINILPDFNYDFELPSLSLPPIGSIFGKDQWSNGLSPFGRGFPAGGDGLPETLLTLLEQCLVLKRRSRDLIYSGVVRPG